MRQCLEKPPMLQFMWCEQKGVVVFNQPRFESDDGWRGSKWSSTCLIIPIFQLVFLLEQFFSSIFFIMVYQSTLHNQAVGVFISRSRNEQLCSLHQGMLKEISRFSFCKLQVILVLS